MRNVTPSLDLNKNGIVGRCQTSLYLLLYHLSLEERVCEIIWKVFFCGHCFQSKLFHWGNFSPITREIFVTWSSYIELVNPWIITPLHSNYLTCWQLQYKFSLYFGNSAHFDSHFLKLTQPFGIQNSENTFIRASLSFSEERNIFLFFLYLWKSSKSSSWNRKILNCQRVNVPDHFSQKTLEEMNLRSSQVGLFLFIQTNWPYSPQKSWYLWHL